MWWDVGTGRMPAAIQLPIAPDNLAELRRWARSSQLTAVLAQRARILLAADGVSNTEIAQRVGVRGRPGVSPTSARPTIATRSSWRSSSRSPAPARVVACT